MGSVMGIVTNKVHKVHYLFIIIPTPESNEASFLNYYVLTWVTDSALI